MDLEFVQHSINWGGGSFPPLVAFWRGWQTAKKLLNSTFRNPTENKPSLQATMAISKADQCPIPIFSEKQGYLYTPRDYSKRKGRPEQPRWVGSKSHLSFQTLTSHPTHPILSTHPITSWPTPPRRPTSATPSASSSSA
jgi:hypothetical protein